MYNSFAVSWTPRVRKAPCKSQLAFPPPIHASVQPSMVYDVVAASSCMLRVAPQACSAFISTRVAHRTQCRKNRNAPEDTLRRAVVPWHYYTWCAHTPSSCVSSAPTLLSFRAKTWLVDESNVFHVAIGNAESCYYYDHKNCTQMISDLFFTTTFR